MTRKLSVSLEMEDHPLEDDIVEEREEIMASASGGFLQKRTAHFLKPAVPCNKASNLKLPYLSPKPWWLLHVEFNGWRDPQKKWEKWVDRMQSKHQSLWKKAGIFEAIMCSKYRFHRNKDLIFGLAERWCSETNTFVFPWGEATITLEDVMILGGFSVLGGPVLLPMEEKELVEIERSLKKVLANFVRMKRHSHLQWLNFFMKSVNRHEHEAFLSLWLSRFVFPGNEFDQIGEHVLPIAVHLSRGVKIALAPAVLASIYRDLSLLKESMAVSCSLEDESGEGSFLALGLWAPLQLVQLWAWERFLMFRPEPNFLSFGDPRAARWHDMKRSAIGNVRPIIDSSGDIFLWRPYTLAVDQWKFPEFYRETEQWVDIGRCLDEALESFARCLRACVLVGIDCEEPYQPHRVAMQFGLDQDIPGLVPRSIEILEVAWINYSKPLNHGASLYVPARLFESDLSIQYQQWWSKSVLVPTDSFQGVSRGQRSSRIQQRRNLLISRQTGLGGTGYRGNTIVAKERASIEAQIKLESNDSDVSPLHLRKGNHPPIVRIQNFPQKQIKTEGNDADVPPGFPPKNNHSPFVRTETSTKQYKQEVFNLNLPPAFHPELNSLSEQNQVPGRVLKWCNNCASSYCAAVDELKISSGSQIQGKSSSAAAANGNSGSLQPSWQPVGRNIYTGNPGNTGHAHDMSIHGNGSHSSCTFKFSSLILANMQAYMNRIGSEEGNKPHGSRIGDVCQLGGKPML
ncbi:unnamed protein product [Coffea canephora]|uniref:Aminotransferase-like plant mobile domain-containing protein n=2 Tax=Coffea TaxID=13442 RepID=A0A068UUC5_COFCA|nr:unnamed protein product [Coffea canephora]